MPRSRAAPAKRKQKASPRRKVRKDSPAIAQKVPAHDPHVRKAIDYCQDVVTGKIPACKYVRAACQRQLDDLARAATDRTWRYRFDEARASRPCRFLELLPHIKGPKAGQLFELEGWQCFIVTTVFGWVRRDTGSRRFRRAYIEVPRGNGKSFMSSGIALYSLAADGESGAEVYAAATTTSQARITYDESEAMLRKRPILLDRLGLKISAHAIYQQATNSTFRALSREAKNHDGKNIHVAIIDELHAHPKRDLWDVIITGAAKRPQSLIWTITTAGFDTSGICYEVRGGVVKMLEGEAPNDALFGVIYTIDDTDDWKDEAAWIKANPNWNASIDHDAFIFDATEALQTASKENNFKTKHLNVWCNAAQAWMQMDAWDACADRSLKEEDFTEDACILSLDLATKVDICAKGKLFFRDLPEIDAEGNEKTVRHFYWFLQSYLPEAAVQNSSNAQYAGWAREGWIRTTPGEVLDHGTVREDIRDDLAVHAVREMAFDPWQATQLVNELQGHGLLCVEVRNEVRNFSEPMKQWEALVLQRRFHHDGNPVMRWMVSNVVCWRDRKDNIYPRKEKPENKIDGPVACIMALNRAITTTPTQGSYLESSDLVIL